MKPHRSLKLKVKCHSYRQTYTRGTLCWHSGEGGKETVFSQPCDGPYISPSHWYKKALAVFSGICLYFSLTFQKLTQIQFLEQPWTLWSWNENQRSLTEVCTELRLNDFNFSELVSVLMKHCQPDNSRNHTSRLFTWRKIKETTGQMPNVNNWFGLVPHTRDNLIITESQFKGLF